MTDGCVNRRPRTRGAHACDATERKIQVGARSTSSQQHEYLQRNVIFLAKCDYVRSGHERVQVYLRAYQSQVCTLISNSCTNLVDNWQRDLGIDNFLQMTDSECADAYASQFAIFLCIADSMPTFLPCLRAADRSMDEIQVDIAKATFVQRFLDCLLDVIVTVIQLELGSEEDIRSRSIGCFAKTKDGLSTFLFVLVPCC